MKKLLLLSLCLLCAWGGQAKKIREVKKPFFSACNTQKLEVNNILLYQDSTVLDIRIYGKSQEEIDLVPTSYLLSEGKQYPLLAKYGFASNGYTSIPERGMLKGRLVFEAVPPEAETIDFIENVERGWKIYGLRLDGKKTAVTIPERLQNRKLDYSRPLPAPVPEYGMIKIKGTLLGYSPVSPVEVEYRVRDWVAWEFRNRSIPIKEDGTFELEDRVMAPGLKILKIGNRELQVFVIPGGELHITVDLPTLTLSETHLFKDEYANIPKMWFEGDYAGLNEELYKFNYDVDPVWGWEHVGAMSVKQLKKKVLDYYRKTREALMKDKEISDVYRRLKLLELTGCTFTNVTGAPYIIGYSPRQKGEKRGSTKIDENYYDEIFRLDSLSSPALLFVSDFKSVVLSCSEKGHNLANFRVLEEDFKRLHKINMTFFKQLPLEAAELATLDSMGTAPVRQYVLAKNDEIRRTLEESSRKTGFTICSLDTVLKGEEILPAILHSHAGRVVLLDLWATWCGPCMRAMKSMEPMKKDLEGKDIDYVFITNRTSPEGEWKITVADIHGEHYRLTNEQVNYLYETYHFPGIPAYLIADRNGKIVYQKVGFPGIGKMKEELIKALE